MCWPEDATCFSSGRGGAESFLALVPEGRGKQREELPDRGSIGALPRTLSNLKSAGSGGTAWRVWCLRCCVIVV